LLGFLYWLGFLLLLGPRRRIEPLSLDFLSFFLFTLIFKEKGRWFFPLVETRG
jgi:hypothetical protein